MPAEWWAPLVALAKVEEKGARTPWLPSLLARNRGTAYLRAHGEPATIDEFRSHVPITTYETLRPWLARIEDGESDVLFAGRPVAFERTGGSTSGPKLIPITREALIDLQRSILPWLASVVTQFGITGRAYFAISPATRRPETIGDIPVGVSDLDYLGPIAGTVLARATAVPFSVAGISDVGRWQRETIHHLAGATDLEVISVWSPTFLLQLLDEMQTDRHRPKPLWPSLKIVSCWASAASRPFAQELARRLPHAHLQPKGLLSTEAVVTVPDRDHRPVLTSHGFFEFDRHGTLHLAADLTEGETYEVVATTGGGLYRYRTGDLVRCDGWSANGAAPRPILEFVGRCGVTSDLVGEKLTDAFVARCLDDVPGFRLLVPDEKGPGYVLAIDGRAKVDPHVVESRLTENPQYAYARTLNQLVPLKIRHIPNLFDRVIALQLSKGVRLADIKPLSLGGDRTWARILEGEL